jgi:sugar phosphate permease
MTEPGDEVADAAGDRLPVSSVDRELVIRTLRVALAQGRLTEDEHDARAAQASASQSRAELAALTADLPAGLLAVLPRASYVWTGVCLIMAAAIVVVAVLLWQPDNGLAFLAFILAALTLLVAPIVTVGLTLDVRHQKRSGGQLPGPGEF